MAGIEAFLILAVAALHLAVVARRVGPDQLVTDAQLGGSFLEQCGQIALAVGEAVGKLETVVRLDTLHFYTTSFSFVRMKVFPLPGFTCRKSMQKYNLPSIRIAVPILMS